MDSSPDLRYSIIRTVTPIIVGVVLAGFTRAGLHVQQEAVGDLVTVVLTAVYYSAARWIETKIPGIGRILLSAGLVPTPPTYPTTPAAAASAPPPIP